MAAYGLINSTLIDAARPTRPVVQMAIFPVEDDPMRRIAELEQQLRDSEAAYDGLVSENAEMATCLRHAHQTIHALEHRLELYTRVMVYAQHGIIRGRR